MEGAEGWTLNVEREDVCPVVHLQPGATIDDYLRAAQSLRDRPARGDVLERVRPDGVTVRFDRATGLFVAFNSDRTIRTLFRPRCVACEACRSLRVDVARFRPDRSQRRCAKLNSGALELRIGTPSVTAER